MHLLSQPRNERRHRLALGGSGSDDEIEAAGSRHPTGAKRGAEHPLIQVAREVRAFPDCDATARECGLDHLIVVRKMKGAGRFDAGEIRPIEPMLPIRPRTAECHSFEIEQDMLRKIGRGSEWTRLVVRKARSADRKGLIFDELLAPWNVPTRWHETNCDIQAFALEIEVDHVVDCRDSNVDSRIQSREVRKLRSEP